MKINPIGIIQYKGISLQNKKTDNQTPQINPICDNSLRIYENNYKNNFLISKNLNFTGVNRAAADFELKGVYNLDCPCCGEKMMTKRQVKTFIQSLQGRRGAAIEDTLVRYQEYLRPLEASVAEIIINDSRKNPDLTLKNIVEFESAKSKKVLEKKQMSMIQKMRNMTKNASKETRKEVHGILNNAVQKIKQSTDEEHFRMTELIDELKAIKHPAKDNSCFEDLIECATDMPNSHTSEDAFFVKYARKSNMEIAERLVDPSKITTEHIRPKSKNGENRPENFIPLCNACNSTRGDMPYTKWIGMHPEMSVNLQNFIDAIYEKIENGEFDGSEYYDTYVDDIIRAFARETDGQIVLKKPNGETVDFEEEEEAFEEKELTIDELREKWLIEYEEYNEKLAVLKHIKEDLKDDEEYKLIVEYSRLAQLRTEAKNEKKIKSIQLNNSKKSLAINSRALEKAEKENESQKRIKELKAKIAKYKKQTERQRAEYDSAKAREDEIKRMIMPLEWQITTPDQVQMDIYKVKERLSKMQAIRMQITSLSDVNSKLSAFEAEERNLLFEAQRRKSENNRKRSSIEFNSPENIESLKKYKVLRQKLNMIDDIDPVEFNKLFKNKDIAPDFILASARKLITDEISELVNKSDAVEWANEDDEINTFNKERDKKIDNAIPLYRDAYKLAELREEYNLLKQKGSEGTLIRKLRELEKRKKDLDKKFNNINIDEKIEKTQALANKVITKYTESFENGEY